MRNIFVALCLTVLACTAGASPAVDLTSGRIEGTLAEGVHIFKGIPFAAPPVGEMRWRAPQPVEPWAGTRDASEFGPICPQMRPTRLPESEDCLTLNVWAPSDVTEPLPVMVWIHGGANVNGSGRTDGTSFARDDVILVSMNYRLGRFGVFAHPELTANRPEGEAIGNYGLLDQIAALEWVQREIAAFGGDSERVTIFGVSAGGSSVNMQMISPLSEGLFHRAISQSGANGMSRPRDLATMERFGAALARQKGVDGIDGLRGLAWRDLVDQSAEYRTQTNMFIDGTAIPMGVGEAFASRLQKNVPYLAGANSYEGSLAAVIPIPAYERVMQDNIEAVTRAYGLPADHPGLFQIFYGDMLFVAPTRYLVEHMRTVPAPAWQYHFDYVMESMDASVPGARHGGEVWFVFERLEDLSIDRAGSRRFGVPEGEYPVSERDREVASMIQDYWIQFATTGAPNGGDRLVWPAYDRRSAPSMVFSNDGIGVQHHVRKRQLDLIQEGYEAAGR